MFGELQGNMICALHGKRYEECPGTVRVYRCPDCEEEGNGRVSLSGIPEIFRPASHVSKPEPVKGE